LIELGAGASLTGSILRIDERVLHFLTGINQIDERLIGVVEAIARESADLPPSQQNIADRIVALWRNAPRNAVPATQLCGIDARGKRAVAAAACASAGLPLFAMPASLVPEASEQFEMLLRVWEREAALTGAALLLEC